jgi:ketosteroid isomerase-like protein
VPHGEKWHGRDGVAQFLFFLNENVEFQQFELKNFIAQDNQVAVVDHFKVLVKATGRYYEPDTVVIWTVEDGKIKQFREFTDTTEAVSAFRE